MEIEFLGATREVTGSCYLLHVGKYRVLVECGLIQGSQEHERHNSDPFLFDPESIDAVVLTHAHIDHSGRLPLLVKRGYTGDIFTHHATADLCSIMLEDAAFLNEREAQWENENRKRKDLPLIEPLYTRADAAQTQEYFRTLEYRHREEIVPGVQLTFYDAGHILGSAIAELKLTEGGDSRTIVFSGDLGHSGAPILREPEVIRYADLVVLESTYGDRLHRSWEATWQEMGDIISNAQSRRGNILIPAFAVGRTQELLYLFKRNFDQWHIGDWQVFLDSPLAIEATEIYAKHAKIYDAQTRKYFEEHGDPFYLPNLTISRAAEDSMKINEIESGAIIIAGSGMCTGGRIKHHFRHNIWRENAHVMMVGFQARGTPGRALVDGAKQIRLWGDMVDVNAQVHTIGGLSAHADQQGLADWYAHFGNRPRVALVHGEPEAMEALAQKLGDEFGADVIQVEFKQRVRI